MCFGGPKMPTPAPIPAPPQAANPNIQGANAQAAQRAAGLGAASTVMTSPQGALGNTAGSGKTLLGG